MSEHETESPQTEQAPQRKLFRSREDRVLGGVAGGLGKYFNVDPIIFRIGFVGLTLVSGIGLILYLGALLFVPVEGEGAPPRRRFLTAAGIVVLVVLGVVLLAKGLFFLGPPFFFPPFPLLFLLLVGGAAYWALRGRGLDTRRRLAIAGLAVVATPFVVVASFWASAAGGGVVMAALVIAAGVLLVIGAFRGGLRWLVVPALLIAIPVGVVAAADVELEGGYGEREYTPTSLSQLPSEYELAAGRLEIDLRQVDFPEGERLVTIDMGMGEAVLVVPEDVCVLTRARIGAGYLRVHDRESGGFDIDSQQSVVTFASTVPRLLVDADIGLGALQIVNDPDELDWDRDRGFGKRFGDHDDDESELAASDACRAAA